MKRLIKIVRHGVLSTLNEQILESTNGDESTTQIRSELEAKVATRKIFQNVARRASKFIYLEDLQRFMLEDKALKTMSLLGGSSESEIISKASLKNWVMVNVLVGIIIAVVYLLILGIATSKFLLFMSSQIVVVAFIFGNSCKTIFEAIMFLFVAHPFDVGDRCEIDGMIAEEMNILTTVFLRFDNQKIIYPNSTLSMKPISNYYRSPDVGDTIELCVHIATPIEKIAIIRQRIISYIESKKDHWYPSPTVVSMNLEELNKLKISVWLRHRMNHQDMQGRWFRRALVVEEMIKIFKEVDIEYLLLPFDVNIRNIMTVVKLSMIELMKLNK
ncbi:Mechanosensitive ion channel protein 8 [Camellia lanceoleosa]|uniref:Mechanosensitive ion channel protein 8 n=1 Tax=Camellia lanceoleosa TaxID=1840588 RepID=A0ACC0ITZ8_9ERIC|nr:Mechanosensitive ion channel protein 8 [Camellia lanceoleosa]